MLYQKKNQAKIIHSNTAEEFEETLNNYLSQLTDLKSKYELTFNNNMGFCAYLVYTETVSIPESLAEEYELRGERHYCKECAYCEIPTDKRFKRCECSYTGEQVWKNSCCCDDFYADMEEFMREDA